MEDEDHIYGLATFPNQLPPTVGELIHGGLNLPDALKNDYTKNLPRTIKETDPANKKIMNTVLFKNTMSALLRSSNPKNLKHKIQKSGQNFITENEDNYREHLYNADRGTWRFDYSESALNKKDPSGPFIMSRLAASTMCETGYPCSLHTKPAKMPKVKHVEESESAKAVIGPETQEK